MRRAPIRSLTGLAAVVVLATAALTACYEAETDDAPACTTDAQCPSERQCTFGHCVAPGVNQLQVQVRLSPPAGSGLVQQQVPSLDLSQGPSVTIKLLEPVRLRGLVRFENDAFTVNVPGELDARALGDIPGLDYRFTSRSHDGLNTDGFGYELLLLPARRYEVTFRPDWKDTPSHTFILEPSQLVESEEVVDLVLPREVATVDGFVRFSDYKAVGGARVTAIMPDGKPGPTVTTESQYGRFEMTLPKHVAEVRLKVQAPAEGPLFPDYTTEPLAPKKGLDVTVPSLPAGTAEFPATLSVQRTAVDGGGLEPMPETSVTCVGTLEGGSLRRSATTNAQGLATFTALPGGYECLVSPTPGLPWSSWHGKLNLAGADKESGLVAPISVILPLRAPIAGLVRDADGAPVETGLVVATRRSDKGGASALAIPSGPYQTTLGPGGAFELRVDPGRYDLRVTPDPATGAPPLTVHDHDATAGATLDIALPEPSLSRLTIVGPDGAALPNVTVELFVAVPDREPGDGPLLLTKGTTGAEGFIDLPVPFSPDPIGATLSAESAWQ